jgi:predicted permease
MGLYRLLDPLSYFVIGFSIAKSYNLQSTAKIPLALRFTKLLTDPFILVSSSSLALGGMLNFSGIERPGIFVTINALFIPLGTMMILTSIGLTLKLSRITHYLRECVLVAVIKFVFIPICMVFAALLLGYEGLDHGLPLKVVMILSAMPVAFTAVVATSIYDLDVDLTNSCLLFTTSCLILVLPVLYYVTR